MASPISKRRLSVTSSLTSALMIAAVAWVQPAMAQNSGALASVDDENLIIVTARKVAEDVQDVPIAITTFTGEDFIDTGLTEFTDVAKLTPNFDARPNAVAGSLTADLNIRGQSSAFFTVNADQAVGVVINGAPITRGTSLFSNLFDVQQIEVLKGPQGTLFGKNTIGGVVSVTTTPPQLGEISGYGQFTLGNFDRADAELVVNIPLGEKVAARFGAALTSRDGFGRTSDAAVQGANFDLANDDEVFFKGSLLFEPSDAVSLRINADYHENNEAPAIQRTLLPSILQVPLGPPPTPNLAIPFALPTGDPDFYAGDFFAGAIDPAFFPGTFAPGAIPSTTGRASAEPFVNAEEFNLNATATLDLGAATLTSITSFRDQKSLTRLENAPGTSIILGQESELFTQELRVNGSALDDRLTWQVGGFFSTETGIDLDILVESFQFQATEADNQTFSLFTQNSFAITDQLNLTAGIRWTTEDRSVTAAGPITLGANGLPTFALGSLTPVEVENTFDGLSWLVSLDYQPTDDVLLYASVSRGFRSGGIDQDAVINIADDPTINVGDVPTDFESEFVTNFEAGFKLDLLDKRLRINAAGFYTDFSDPQVLDSIPVAGGGGGLVTIITNAGSAQLQGFEVEVSAEPIDDLVLGGSIGYVNGEFSDFITALGVDNEGLPIGGRELTWTLSGRYEFDLSDEVRAGLQGNFFWFGEQDVATPTVIAALPAGFGTLPQYNILNAQIDFDLPNVGRGLNIAIFGTNLTNEDFFTNGATFDFRGLGAGIIANRVVGEPRTYGVRLSQKF